MVRKNRRFQPKMYFVPREVKNGDNNPVLMKKGGTPFNLITEPIQKRKARTLRPCFLVVSYFGVMVLPVCTRQLE